MTTVTRITQDATLDDLTLTDYRDMVQDLRTTLSLEKLIIVLSSQYSKPLWAKVEKGEVAPNRNQRNELRRYYGMPSLPQTVADAVGENTSPDAAVWKVGEGIASSVIMVTTPEPLTLHVNGAVSVASEPATMPTLPLVTPVTSARKRAQYTARPFVSNAQLARQKQLYSLGIDANWREIINRGLDALEGETNRNG